MPEFLRRRNTNNDSVVLSLLLQYKHFTAQLGCSVNAGVPVTEDATSEGMPIPPRIGRRRNTAASWLQHFDIVADAPISAQQPAGCTVLNVRGSTASLKLAVLNSSA